MSAPNGLAEQVAALPWPALIEALDAEGVAKVTGLLAPPECASLVRLYDDAQRFRSKVVMGRHGYGSGEYRYFAYPLPPLVATLRELLYPKLVPLANRWHEALGSATRFPDAHAAFVERCHAAGQLRPTPLLLRYENR